VVQKILSAVGFQAVTNVLRASKTGAEGSPSGSFSKPLNQWAEAWNPRKTWATGAGLKMNPDAEARLAALVEKEK